MIFLGLMIKVSFLFESIIKLFLLKGTILGEKPIEHFSSTSLSAIFWTRFDFDSCILIIHMFIYPKSKGNVMGLSQLQVLIDEGRVVTQEVQHQHRQDPLFLRLQHHIVLEVVLVVASVLALGRVFRVPSAVQLVELFPFSKLVHLLLAHTFWEL